MIESHFYIYQNLSISIIIMFVQKKTLIAGFSLIKSQE